MKESGSLGYSNETEFEQFIEGLRQQRRPEWNWLYDHFRARVIPWLHKKDGRLPSDSILTVEDFIEEAFSKSLIRFYEMFKEGEFKDLGQLRGLMFRIAELKLKEGYYKVKMDRRIFFKESLQEEGDKLSTETSPDKIIEQREIVQSLEKHLSTLPTGEKELLMRFADGERLKDIATDLGIDETSCRMRKYRAMKKLKAIVKKSG